MKNNPGGGKMHNAVAGAPTPLASLDDLMEYGDTSERPMKVFIGHNLGFRTFVVYVPMHEFYKMSEVANDPIRDGEQISQRKLDPVHAQKLALYILKGLVDSAIKKRIIDKKPVPPEFLSIQEIVGKQPYLTIQPIVVNIRDCDAAGQSLRGHRLETKEQETASFKIFLSQRHVLWVVDGQHRRRAMELVFEFLDGVISKRIYPKKGGLYSSDGEMTAAELMLWNECFNVARSFCTVAVEIHLGLSIDQERQLFHDLNRLGKKVEVSLALHFDSSNPINLFIKERLIDGLHMQVQEKDQKDWHSDTGAITRKDLVGINAILFLNKTNIGGATPAAVTPKTEVAYHFWQAVWAIPGLGEEQAREKTVAAQPVVLKAIAKLVFDFAFSNRRGSQAEEHLETLLSGISDIDFSHENPMWRYYELSEQEREQFGLGSLASYLPPAGDSANRDVGSYQGGFMRFGAKHNDIFPLLADMIRWKLELPSRHS
jgi:hypothetical protein